MKRLFTILAIIFLFAVLGMPSTGCVSNPQQAAGEIRAIYTEAQSQLAIAKTDPTANKAKLADLEDKLNLIGPGIDAVEIAATTANQDPAKFVDFQALIAQYKPKVEAYLLKLVLRRYLGS